MARTGQMRGKAKKRERPLGVAIGWGLAATLTVGILIVGVLFLIPGTIAHQFISLVRHASSATLPLDPLYQGWAEKIAEEDTLFGTPFSLLCGGLVLGWLAPSYVSRRRILLSGAGLGLGILAVSIWFEWIAALNQQHTLNATEGGPQVILTAPPDLILRQAFYTVIWTAICVLGTWIGFALRRRKQGTETAGLRTVGR